MVLATDMTKHFADISKLKSRIQATGKERNKINKLICEILFAMIGLDFEIEGKDKKLFMESIIHSSDVSNPIRPWKVCFQWTTKVMAEFWAQGDQEKQLNLPVTYLCDRCETNTAKSQQGFIDFIVKPLFELMANVIPELSIFMVGFENNKEKWAELISKYDSELSNNNYDSVI